MKIMSIMAHQDDFEFNAGGTFALLRRIHGAEAQFKILVTTRGASGHHSLGPEETFRRRENEAMKSAAMIGAEYECLKCLDGEHLPGQIFIDRNFLGGLWNAIRAFEPDFIFCPPVTSDPLAGIHIDHYNTAWGVRMVAYQLTVPRAYPDMHNLSRLKTKSPVILNVDDTYSAGKNYDLAFDIAGVYEKKLQMALCHESQIYEWLPWNSNEPPPDREEFQKRFRQRHSNVNLRYGNDDSVPREYFMITKWGAKSDTERVRSQLVCPGCLEH